MCKYYFYWNKKSIKNDNSILLDDDLIDVLEVIDNNVTFEELISFSQEIKNSSMSVFTVLLYDLFEQRKNFGSFKEVDILSKQNVVDGSTGLKDKYGNTILHYFALKNIQCVLEHPSCNTVKNDFGLTPLQCMINAGFDCSSHPDYENIKLKKSNKCKLEFVVEE